MAAIEPWEELARHLKDSLREDLHDGGVTIEAEESLDVGVTSVDIVVESTGDSLEEQRLGFGSLCDLLHTRRQEGKRQVLGCLLVDGEPLAEAFVDGLTGMVRNGDFTPVIPLDRSRAKALLEVEASLFELVDKATVLIDIASTRDPITTDVAATALAEIDELVERAISESA